MSRMSRWMRHVPPLRDGHRRRLWTPRIHHSFFGLQTMPISFYPSPEIPITRLPDTVRPEASAVLKVLRSKTDGAPKINEILKAPLVPQVGPSGSPLAG